METVGKLLICLLPVGCPRGPHLMVNTQLGNCTRGQDRSNAQVVRVADGWSSEA